MPSSQCWGWGWATTQKAAFRMICPNRPFRSPSSAAIVSVSLCSSCLSFYHSQHCEHLKEFLKEATLFLELALWIWEKMYWSSRGTKCVSLPLQSAFLASAPNCGIILWSTNVHSKPSFNRTALEKYFTPVKGHILFFCNLQASWSKNCTGRCMFWGSSKEVASPKERLP